MIQRVALNDCCFNCLWFGIKHIIHPPNMTCGVSDRSGMCKHAQIHQNSTRSATLSCTELLAQWSELA